DVVSRHHGVTRSDADASTPCCRVRPALRKNSRPSPPAIWNGTSASRTRARYALTSPLHRFSLQRKPSSYDTERCGSSSLKPVPVGLLISAVLVGVWNAVLTLPYTVTAGEIR